MCKVYLALDKKILFNKHSTNTLACKKNILTGKNDRQFSQLHVQKLELKYRVKKKHIDASAQCDTMTLSYSTIL